MRVECASGHERVPMVLDRERDRWVCPECPCRMTAHYAYDSLPAIYKSPSIVAQLITELLDADPVVVLDAPRVHVLEERRNRE